MSQGKYVNGNNLIEHYQLVLETFIKDCQAQKDELKPHEQRLLHLANHEQWKMKNTNLHSHVRTHRQKALMRACEARCRIPQRLVKLSMSEERGRWLTTLQAYDRCLYESMHVDRPAQKAEMVCV